MLPHLVIGAGWEEKGWGVRRAVGLEGSVLRVNTIHRVEDRLSRLGIFSDIRAMDGIWMDDVRFTFLFGYYVRGYLRSTKFWHSVARSAWTQ